MTYEIEKRSLFTSKARFDRCQRHVKNHAKFVGKHVFKSFLFRNPEYIRIRIIKGHKNVIITRKSGTYHDAARKEHNQTIKLSKLRGYLQKIKSQGFEECVCFKTISYAYKLDDLRVDFNTITYLGKIVEVEALTKNKRLVPVLKQKVSATMKKLNLHELSPTKYQKMMNNAFTAGLKPISKHKFSI